MGQDDLVEIVGSSNPRLANLVGRDRLITWHELRRQLSADPDAVIGYRRNGVRYTHEHARENPELVRRDPIAHRFIGHRNFDLAGPKYRW